jgi:hypothetical protein
MVTQLMVCKNLPAAPHQQKNAKQIDKMSDSKPKRKPQRLLVHAALLVETDAGPRDSSARRP